MTDTVNLGSMENHSTQDHQEAMNTEQPESKIPSYDSLEKQFVESSKLVDDIVLKKYLHKLTDLEIVPLGDELKQICDIRLFKITEMVYQKDEYSTYKFASVFSSVQNLNCGVFIIADSDGKKTDFYMGVRSLDNIRTTKSLKDTLRNALCGQFPGVKSEDLLDDEAQSFLSEMPARNIASVSCIANNKDEDFKDNDTFIQGLEKLALAMQGQIYTAIILAKSTPADQLDEIRHAYETIYTQISPFANMQVSYGTNEAHSISDALSHSTSIGDSHSENKSVSTGTSYSEGTSENESTSRVAAKEKLAKRVGTITLGTLGIVTAPLSGGASIVVAGAIMGGLVGLSAIEPSTKSKGTSKSKTQTDTKTHSEGETITKTKNVTEGTTNTKGVTIGTSDNMQLSKQNKTLLNTLERMDQQIKRIDECDSLGMWECAAYFLSDSQETVEMAAGTYKALMKGSKSGVETSAINYWGRQSADKLPILRDYITNFMHPVFAYRFAHSALPVTPASLVSSNELAIQMGLPRKAICGFPVIEHADFGKEVVSYEKKLHGKDLSLGKIFSMGTEMNTEVNLDINSLTMHTFITGSTGSGKSNAIYSILEKVSCCKVKNSKERIKYMVIEPAKGEYKNRFGYRPDVHVYGTNIQKTPILKINPFSFPEDIHVTEHIDRLIEIFNVCWPMYAAMPAILKESVERSYKAAGWDLNSSTTKYQDSEGRKLYPCFMDVLEQINRVIEESKYSSDSKGDYAGALCTRVKSLTNGFYREIFSQDEISNEDLFNQNVIVDLSRIGSMETKALIMGILVMKLQEFRMSEAVTGNSSLRHVTVLEEAHNLLKRTSSEQSADSANLIGKSVEMLSNAIAEMRTYGEGFIIADQAPGLLDMSVIRNTNTKIILRLPDQSDRELVGRSAALNDNQIIELSKLKTGVAAVYQNDWQEAVLCHIDYSDSEEKVFEYTAPERNSYDIIDLVKLLLLPVPLKKKIDVIHLKKLEETIYKANIKAGTKIMLKNYLNNNDVESVRILRQKIMYDVFNTEDIFGLIDPDFRNIESWYRYACSEMIPGKDYFDEEELHKIVALLAKENALREKDELSIKLYDAYMKYI